ncbi:MAG TPA: ribosomal protein S18-alanine N-acetyltransferase [Pyrinomonadaceae bacterium]|nr:ribosomal protein S18-alanine N-acetyltransferase [Pyrinomonadaceae bacterium]
MAFLQTIRNFFISSQPIEETEIIVPAPPTVYDIRPLTDKQLKEVMRLNLRCFRNGENYTKHTFNYLLSDSRTLSYRIVTPEDEMVGFVFVMMDNQGAGHITTIGVAPEHRRRGLAEKLLAHSEEALRNRQINTVMLEVRVSNIAAQSLYRSFGYSVVQRIGKYYNNGEDCFLMMKSLF